MKQFRPVAAVAACALALSACGEDASAGKATGSAGSLGAAKAVVTDYVGAVYSGDSRACDLESEAFTTAQNEGVGAQGCTERIESIKALLTDGEPLIDVKKVTVEVTEDGDAALAAVRHETEDMDGTYRLVLVDGSWRIDSEVAAGADAEDADEEPAAGGSATEPRKVSEDEAVALERAFCAVKVGTTRADVEAILGAPSAEGTDDDGQAEIDWLYNQDSYTVWFGDAGTVTSFSSSTPREGVSCEA